MWCLWGKKPHPDLYNFTHLFKVKYTKGPLKMSMVVCSVNGRAHNIRQALLNVAARVDVLVKWNKLYYP